MLSTIELDDIRIYAYHGCFEEEQRVGNWFTVNVSLDVECQKAAETDDIANALSYVEVYRLVRREMAQNSHLLENVVMRIIKALRAEFAHQGLVGGRVKVSKMAPPVGGSMKSVSLTMQF